MNILILTSSNPYKKSGVVAYDIYKGLRNNGHCVKLLVNRYGHYNDKNIVCLEKFSDIIIRNIKIRFERIVIRVLNILNKNYTMNTDYHFQDYNQTKNNITTIHILNKLDFNPKIILYLFPLKSLNTRNLFELNKTTGATIFWNLMDSAALTGGCHYCWDCTRYTTGCGKCPALYSSDENDQSSINFKFKNKHLRKTDIHFITGTEWQYQQAKKSLLLKNKPIHKILLSVNPEVFKPISKIHKREELNIPKDKKIIFIGAISLSDKRKGMKYLIDVLNKLNNTQSPILDKIFLLIAGNKFKYIKDDLPFEYKYLGMLDNNEQLAGAFQAADLFVCPSIEDSGPLMINQSIMCGTPVVSFKMGVALDLVISGKTGYLAELRNSEDMAKGLLEILLLNNNEIKKMATNCRDIAFKLYHPSIKIEKLEKMFKKTNLKDDA